MDIRKFVMVPATLAALLLGWLFLRGPEQGPPAGGAPPAPTPAATAPAGARPGPTASQRPGAGQPAAADARSRMQLSLDVPFVEQLDALERAAAAGEVAAATALIEGWQRCRSDLTVFGQTRQQQVDWRVDASYQVAEGLLATVEDEALREAGIQALAAFDPAELAREIEQEQRQRERLCDGIDARGDGSQRRQQFRRWQQRAAELDDVHSRRSLVTLAFTDHPWEGMDSAALEQARMKPVVLAQLSQGLAQGDPYMLGELAVYTAEGYFEPPDPVLGHAYSRAYLALVDAARASGWGDGVQRLRNHAQVVALDARLADQLDARERRRAQAMAGRLASCCRAWSGS